MIIMVTSMKFKTDLKMYVYRSCKSFAANTNVVKHEN